MGQRFISGYRVLLDSKSQRNISCLLTVFNCCAYCFSPWCLSSNRPWYNIATVYLYRLVNSPFYQSSPVNTLYCAQGTFLNSGWAVSGPQLWWTVTRVARLLFVQLMLANQKHGWYVHRNWPFIGSLDHGGKHSVYIGKPWKLWQSDAGPYLKR